MSWSLVLAIGFIPTVIFAWAFELTSEGLKKERDVDRSRSITLHTGNKLDRLIMVVLALALGYFALDKFVLSPQRQAEELATATLEARQEGRTDALMESHGDKSIAVLPFVNMSDDASNEYFSDGISEELLNLLARIPELRVIARTSSFSYKGRDILIADVARELNVAYVLEGSVRKAGNQVRITAQLIEARSDTHLWSQTFDRTLDNIFAIQDEIASAVVEHLKVTLLGAKPSIEMIDHEAYSLYLQGRYLNRQRTPEAFEQAISLLQQALEIAPDYPAAWHELGYTYQQQSDMALRPHHDGIPLSKEAVSKALEIDPEYAPALATLGWLAMHYDNDLITAAQHYQTALDLEISNLDIITQAAILFGNLGRLDEALALQKYVLARDPVNIRALNNIGVAYTNQLKPDEALPFLRTVLRLNPGNLGTQYNIGHALLLKKEPRAALLAMQNEMFEAFRLIGLVMAYYSLGQMEQSDSALEELISKYEQVAAYNVAIVLAYRNEADRAFTWLDKAVEYKDSGLPEIPLQSEFANIRNDPRWLPFLESIGKSPTQLDAIEFKVVLPEGRDD